MDREIQKLTIADYDEIIRVWAISGLPFKPYGRDSRPRLEQEMNRADSAFFGLFEDGVMLAVGLASYDGRKGWIQRVAVDPDRRGELLGPRVVRACEEFLKSRGAEVISCLIEDMNYPSISMFQNLGYELWEPILYFSKRNSDDA
ncbi:MAG: GNAT family N-acetyltransferase [bacterium]